MFKVKLSFDTDRLEQDILEQLYDKVDEIFESEDLNCVDRALVRVYEDKGREEDYGRFWAAIFALKQTPELAENLKECIWYNGSAKEKDKFWPGYKRVEKTLYKKGTGLMHTMMSGAFLRKMALNISRAQDIIPLCRCQNLM